MSLTNINNQKVLVRVGYDLPNLEHTARIKDSLETIQALLKNQNKVILLTHWGRPKGQIVAEKSTQKIVQAIESVLGFKPEFVNQYAGFQKAKELIDDSKSKLFLLENTRFDPREKSKSNQDRKALAEKYAILGEVFVDEAFSVSHRNEATNTELRDLLPNYKGLSYTEETEQLKKLKQNPARPLAVIMAGAKLETKLPIISEMLKIADKVMLGGMLSFSFIAYKNSLVEDNQVIDLASSKVELDFIPVAKELFAKYPNKLVIPVDLVYGDQEANLIANPDNSSMAYDVGEKTIQKYTQIITESKTIFWNGTLGYYEKPPFDRATLEIAKAIAQQKDLYSIIGGGDTVSAIEEKDLKKFNFVSMGGGATLDYLIG